MGARFLCDRLKTYRIIGEDVFRVAEEFSFYSAKLRRVFRVPVGFPTDFASIPWGMRNLFHVNGKHVHAAVIHDFLCVHGAALGITQKQADDVFKEAMEVLKVPGWQRATMYRGVRMYQSVKGWFK